MKNIVAIHMEVSGSNHLEHINELRWRETSKIEHGGGPLKAYTRAQMYDFVKSNPKQAYAISTKDNTYAFLEAVDNGHVQYVKTIPDSTKSDNLLSLPRY